MISFDSLTVSLIQNQKQKDAVHLKIGYISSKEIGKTQLPLTLFENQLQSVIQRDIFMPHKSE